MFSYNIINNINTVGFIKRDRIKKFLLYAYQSIKHYKTIFGAHKRRNFFIRSLFIKSTVIITTVLCAYHSSNTSFSCLLNKFDESK